MKNIILLILILITFNACSLKQTTYTLNKYTLKYDNLKKYNTINKTIIINKPTINPIYNTTDMIYSTQEYKVESYIKNKWSDIPNLIIHQELMSSFDKNGLFNTTYIYPNKEKANYSINTHIYKIENKIKNNISYAILSIKFEIYKDKKLFDTYFYDKSLKNISLQPYDFVKSENILFNEIINDLSNRLYSKLKN
ncbi:hypothetical protein CPU12_12095 [Malaciobacter molluscorum LMG 25693]|uniref:Lipid asymmetry ABC transporter MlaABCDEF component MlaB n=1 Tax=Malaciobacter molluscorum LMG 25693 TaxID=870501 RepID=A0A2G1DFC4_9BACT|nr:hypothetical protein [Malaciobacter molluscorum]AXX91259.1 putative lipid asymmetry ABC transporter MlaABCDEF component MlaB [Malaciobacter molluscorum LMG 25693]PHO17150.1 hypothetical protein CPU12_12095 [Malaciobacter molluscorum LMG 25693]